MAILSLVPTPSAEATSTGSLRPFSGSLNSPPNDPSSDSTPSVAVFLTSFLTWAKARSCASMSTPASL